MNGFARWLGGNLRFQIKGQGTNRFLNLCLYHGIPLYDMVHRGNLICSVPVRYFSHIKEIAYKTGCILLLQRKSGLPFWLRRHRKHVVFLCGMLIAFFLMQTMASRIWNITIDGNQYYTDTGLVHFLEEKGYLAGIRKNSVSCDDVEQLLRNEYTRISWVSARIQGTRLMIELREGEFYENIPVKEPGHLVAESAGTVVSIVTRNGVPRVKTGDVVTEGQILISGEVAILDDADTIVNTHRVSADGDVRVRRDVAYQDRFPAVHEQRTCIEENYRPWIQIGNISWHIPFLNMESQGSVRDVTRSYYQLRFFADFYLPVYCGILTERRYTVEEVPYEQAVCEEMAQKRILRFMEEQTKEGQLIDTDCTIRTQGNTCYVSGTLTIIETIGVFQSITVEESGEEEHLEAS